MNKIKEYSVISADNTTALKMEVNNKINEGWQPYGNMSIGWNNQTLRFEYCQPIVLHYGGQAPRKSKRILPPPNAGPSPRTMDHTFPIVDAATPKRPIPNPPQKIPRSL